MYLFMFTVLKEGVGSALPLPILVFCYMCTLGSLCSEASNAIFAHVIGGFTECSIVATVLN